MRKKGLTKSISPAPFSCFSVRSTSTLFSNIQFSEGYSDFLVSLPFLIYPYSVNIMDDSVEVVYLCPGKEKRKAYTYEIIDVFQQ